jgi:hypothetical protein
VVVPAGNGTLEFIYQPASLVLGLWLAGLAVIVLAGWLLVIWIQTIKTHFSDHESVIGSGGDVDLPQPRPSDDGGGGKGVQPVHLTDVFWINTRS